MNNGYEILPEDEYRRLLRSIPDSDVVPVAHLKDVMAWLREQGYDDKHLNSDGMIMFAERMLYWMAENCSSRKVGVLN